MTERRFLFAVESEHENGAADDIRSLLWRGLAENRIRANEGATWYKNFINWNMTSVGRSYAYLNNDYF